MLQDQDANSVLMVTLVIQNLVYLANVASVTITSISTRWEIVIVKLVNVSSVSTIRLDYIARNVCQVSFKSLI